MRGFRRNAKQDFRGVRRKPDVVLVIDVIVVRGVRGKPAFCIDVQRANTADAEILEPAVLGGSQIPDAVLVDKPVRLDRRGLSLYSKRHSCCA